MRKPPVTNLPELEKKPDSGQMSMVRSYRLITPLFGGGVEPGVVDETTPIRGSSIRGQLRFWWRATRGAQFGNHLDQLKAAEDLIWGSTGSVARVTLAVLGFSYGTPLDARNARGEPVNVGDAQSDYSYVAFPLREEGGVVRKDITFDLRLVFPTGLEDDVRAALWAWDTFGGIGARTRRGFGALACTAVRFDGSSPEQPSDWHWQYVQSDAAAGIAADIARFVSNGAPHKDLPHLSKDPRRLKVLVSSDDELKTWQRLFGSLRDFRQKRLGGPFGRSVWPEPDVIRDRTGQSLPAHRPPIYSPRIDKFPRGQFGLPIVFKFKDDHPSATNRDPRQTQLEGQDYKGQDYNRYASRLILRPVACDDGAYVGLAAILNGPPEPPGGLKLSGASSATEHAALTTFEANEIRKKHVDYDGNTDVLQAFLDSL